MDAWPDLHRWAAYTGARHVAILSSKQIAGEFEFVDGATGLEIRFWDLLGFCVVEK